MLWQDETCLVSLQAMKIMFYDLKLCACLPLCKCSQRASGRHCEWRSWGLQAIRGVSSRFISDAFPGFPLPFFFLRGPVVNFDPHKELVINACLIPVSMFASVLREDKKKKKKRVPTLVPSLQELQVCPEWRQMIQGGLTLWPICLSPHLKTTMFTSAWNAKECSRVLMNNESG